MGWIVYEESSGRMIKYYKTRAAARGVVTKHNTERSYDWGPVHGTYHYRPERAWSCCSYQDFEGILMGLRGDRFRMWQWVKNNPNG